MRAKNIITRLLITFSVAVVSIVVFMSLAFSLGETVFTSRDLPHKSDEELISNFYAHRAEFDQLLQMITEDNGLIWVDDIGPSRENIQTSGVTQARIAAYRKLFLKTGVLRGFNAYRDTEMFQFIASSQGMVGSGSHKGYIYSRKPLKPIVDNLETYRFLENRPYGFPVYRHIEGNWYLYIYAE